MRATLVDTDVLSGFLRNHPKAVENFGNYLKEHEAVSFSIITYYEILNGLLYKDARGQLERFNRFAELNKIVLLTTSATRRAAEINAELRKEGRPIGHTDCLIAGIAIANGLQLATNNTAHFERIKGLDIVNWLR